MANLDAHVPSEDETEHQPNGSTVAFGPITSSSDAYHLSNSPRTDSSMIGSKSSDTPRFFEQFHTVPSTPSPSIRPPSGTDQLSTSYHGRSMRSGPFLGVEEGDHRAGWAEQDAHLHPHPSNQICTVGTHCVRRGERRNSDGTYDDLFVPGIRLRHPEDKKWQNPMPDKYLQGIDYEIALTPERIQQLADERSEEAEKEERLTVEQRRSEARQRDGTEITECCDRLRKERQIAKRGSLEPREDKVGDREAEQRDLEDSDLAAHRWL